MRAIFSTLLLFILFVPALFWLNYDFVLVQKDRAENKLQFAKQVDKSTLKNLKQLPESLSLHLVGFDTRNLTFISVLNTELESKNLTQSIAQRLKSADFKIVDFIENTDCTEVWIMSGENLQQIDMSLSIATFYSIIHHTQKDSEALMMMQLVQSMIPAQWFQVSSAFVPEITFSILNNQTFFSLTPNVISPPPEIFKA
jgi:hypothetical protein